MTLCSKRLKQWLLYTSLALSNLISVCSINHELSPQYSLHKTLFRNTTQIVASYIAAPKLTTWKQMSVYYGSHIIFCATAGGLLGILYKYIHPHPKPESHLPHDRSRSLIQGMVLPIRKLGEYAEALHVGVTVGIFGGLCLAIARIKMGSET